MACGQGKNRSTDIFYFLYVCRNLNFGWFISLFDSTPVHFSPTFRSEGMDPYWKLLVTLWNRFVVDVILHDYSDEYILEDSPNS